MAYGAFGLVEVLGEANAVLVTDQMLKAAEVTYETQDTKCMPSYLSVAAFLQ